MRTEFSGREVVKVLTKNRFHIVDRTGSHVKLRYEHPTNDDDIRVISVPMHDSISIGTLRNIADQSGAVDFPAWCGWVDENLYRRQFLRLGSRSGNVRIPSIENQYIFRSSQDENI